jgi:hypothetical protein
MKAITFRVIKPTDSGDDGSTPGDIAVGWDRSLERR